MINKRVYNHLSKSFARESYKVVAARESIRGATSG
jgi:hypothetical protein